MATIVHTALDILNERTFPSSMHDYEVNTDYFDFCMFIPSCVHYISQCWNNPPYVPTMTNGLQVKLNYITCIYHSPAFVDVQVCTSVHVHVFACWLWHNFCLRVLQSPKVGTYMYMYIHVHLYYKRLWTSYILVS